MFVFQQLIEGNYTDDITAIRNSLSLVSEFINEHFHPLEKFNTSVKVGFTIELLSKMCLVGPAPSILLSIPHC
jgi:hypothetical protein